MAMRYPGGLIAPSPVNAAYPSGVWTQSQTIPYASQNVWQNDQYWRNTTLLLHGDGTNGAQNNTFLDSSSNNFTITRNGNTTQGAFTPFQQSGYWSNYFDGSGDYLDLPSSANLATSSSDFTIECWAYFNATTNGYIFSGSGGTIQLSSGSVISYDGSNHTLGAVSVGQWFHLVVCRSGSTIKAFLNGVQGSSWTNSGTQYTHSSGRLGAEYGTGSTGLNGYISNYRFIVGTALYTADFTPPVSPLTAVTNTKLLTCQSNRFIDNSSNVFTITVNGNTSVQAFQPFPGPTTWSASVLGGSGYFDGSGDYLTFPDSASFDYSTGDFTCDMWVYPTTVSGDKVLLQLGSYGSGQTGIVFLLSNGGKVFYGYNGGFGGESSGSVLANTWSYLSFVRSSGTLKMYVNGAEKYSTSFTSSIAPSTDFSIGSNSNPFNSQFSGYLASLRLSNTARSPSIPTAPITNDGNTQLLLNFTNAGIFDNAQMNDLETVGNAQVSTSIVKYGTGSMAFDGTGDYLLAPSTPNFAFGTGDFTVEMWLYPTASFGSGGVNIVGINSSGGGLFVGGTNKIAWNLFGTGDLVAFSSFTSSYNNVWTHVAYTRLGTTGRLFINGVQQASGTDSTNYTVTTNFAIGAANNGNQPYTGYIDDLRITKGVARYITNFTPPIARMPNQ